MAIRKNPHNYNFWIVRRRILNSFKFNPHKELLWTEELILEQPKNFLCWHHRKIIASSNLNSTSAQIELNLTERVIRSDLKNYFAYAHRQWAINTFKFENLGLLKDEMKFTSELIKEDIRNNSAWNQRFFAIQHFAKFDQILVRKELEFALENIEIVNENDSAWNYLRGLLKTYGSKKLYQFQKVLDFCDKKYFGDGSTCVNILSFLIESKIEMLLDDEISDSILNCKKVQELCNLMATKYDEIRRNYWKFVYKRFCYDRILKAREHEKNLNLS